MYLKIIAKTLEVILKDGSLNVKIYKQKLEEEKTQKNRNLKLYYLINNLFCQTITSSVYPTSLLIIELFF